MVEEVLVKVKVRPSTEKPEDDEYGGRRRGGSLAAAALSGDAGRLLRGRLLNPLALGVRDRRRRLQ